MFGATLVAPISSCSVASLLVFLLGMRHIFFVFSGGGRYQGRYIVLLAVLTGPRWVLYFRVLSVLFW